MLDPIAFLADVAFRSSLVLGAVFALLFIRRRASASERHFTLLLGLIVTALVPAGLLMAPRMVWTIPLSKPVELKLVQASTVALPVKTQAEPVSTVPAVIENNPSFGEYLISTNGMIVLLGIGMVVQMILLTRAGWTWRKIRARATRTSLPGDVFEQAQSFIGNKAMPPICISDQVAVPLLAGWLRPAVVLPAESRDWPRRNLLMVLCHELAHFIRGDAWVLPLNGLLRILYWWHPLVWLGLARLRRERENACDDLVLSRNFRASDYADLIVATARKAQAFPWPNGALAMATSSNLSERVRTILDPALNRKPANRTTIFLGLLIAAAAAWIMAAAHLQAEDEPANPAADILQVALTCTAVEIPETVYQQQAPAIEEAVKSGNLPFLVNLPGMRPAALPGVVFWVDEKAEIELEKKLVSNQPTKILLAHVVKNPDGTISQYITEDDASPAPSIMQLGIKIKIRSSAPRGQAIPMHFDYQIDEVDGYRDDKNYSISGHPVEKQLNLVNEKPQGFWAGDVHLYNLLDILNSTDNEQIKALPPRSISPHRLALIVTAHTVSPSTVQLESTAPNPTSPDDTSKPHLDIRFQWVGISEKTYAAQKEKIDAALDKDDVISLAKIPGVSFLTGIPRVTTPAGQKASVAHLKPIPSLSPARYLGLEGYVTPTFEADGKTIHVEIKSQMTSLEGWMKGPSGEREPVINVASTHDRKSLPNGTCYLWVGEGKAKTREALGLDPDPQGDTSPMRIALVLAVHPVDKDRPAATPPIPGAAPTPPAPLSLVLATFYYFEINEDNYAQQPVAIEEALNKGDISFLSKLPTFRVLGVPQIRVKLDNEATVQVLKKIPCPVKFIRDPDGKFVPSGTPEEKVCGITTTVIPSVSSDGGISLDYHDTIAGFHKWDDRSDKAWPYFASKSALKLELANGKPMGLWARTRFYDVWKIMDETNSVPEIPSENDPRVRIGLILTASRR